MTQSSIGLDQETEESLDSALDHPESEAVIDALDEALSEAENDDAQYWIRTALQRVLAESEDRENS